MKHRSLLNLSVLALVACNLSLSQQADWPSVNVASTFNSTISLYTWDGSNLNHLQDAQAVLLVDAVRNKAMLHSKIQVPLFGSINADMLVDFTNGSTMMYTPFLGLCERDSLDG